MMNVMRRYQISLFFVFFVVLTTLLTACIDPIQHGIRVEGKPVEVTLGFGTKPAFDVVVSTKAGHTLENESKVWNLYILIFDANGNKIYGHFFDATNQGQSTDGSDWWTVDNTLFEGTVHLKTETQSGCTIVGISNIDAEMVNISPEFLGTVNTLSQLEGMKASLNQLIVSRSGYFPMSGKVNGVTIDDTDSPTIRKGIARVELMLERLDAKVRFNIQVAPNDVEHHKYVKIASFTPTEWRVVNIPNKAFVLPSTEDATNTANPEDNFFSYRSSHFDSEVGSVVDHYSGSTTDNLLKHSFTFYMLENKRSMNPDPATPTPPANPDFSDRERENKTAAGLNDGYIYPDPLATYVVIKGRIGMKNDKATMSVDPGSPDYNRPATLSAEVQYTIHLGDFRSNMMDYSVLRNNSYTYNIYIYDVEDIRVEVEVDNEREPAAEGRVVVALEDIYVADAHYCSHVMTFHAENLDAGRISWFVETPFHPDGVTVSPGQSTAGIDFDWVLFRLNKIPEGATRYDEHRREFKPLDYVWPEDTPENEKTMNVIGLVNYLNNQKTLYDQRVAGTDPEDDFDADNKICVTAFINEYYYEKNPLNGDEHDPELWKQFVNKPIRQMHILSQTLFSRDRDSRQVGSTFTIQQQSIQTIYNTNHPTLATAWGCEHTDDNVEKSGVNHSINLYTEGGDSRNRGNDDLNNGRNNSVLEWDLRIGAGGHMLHNRTKEGIWNEGDPAKWSDYLNLEIANDTPQLWGPGNQNPDHSSLNLQYLRYSCLSRNRDNDGDGYIDLDEIRWYMGATNQLVGLFLGSYGITDDARLYQRNAQQRASTVNEVWRQHVVSSSRYDDASSSASSDVSFRVIWAEQGVAGSTDAASRSNSGISTYSTRCLRNLGYYNGEDITHADLSVVPENFIQVQRYRGRYDNDEPIPADTYQSSNSQDYFYIFDCTRLNDESKRYYTNRDLVAHDENAEEACLYECFETLPVRNHYEFETVFWMKDMFDYMAENIETSHYCPPGYRVPNIRELAVMRDFIPKGVNNQEKNAFFSKGIYAFSRTYWSFGTQGDEKEVSKNKKYFGFGASSQKILMAQEQGANGADQKTKSIRCVRDIKVNE